MDASWARGFDTLKRAKYASDGVVLGTITARAQVQRDKVGIVYTDFAFHIDRVMWDPHHKLGSPNIMLHQTGGVINTTRFEIDDDPLFQIGEQAILFLVVYSPGHAYVNGGPTGRFLVQHGVVRPRDSQSGMAIYIGHPVSESAFLTEIQNA